LNGTINISQFVNHLKQEGLIIVSREDYEQKINFNEVRLVQLQKKLLSKENLTIKQIVKGQLLPVKTRQSINNWIDKGVFADDEVFKSKDGSIRIVMCVVNRIRKIKNIE